MSINAQRETRQFWAVSEEDVTKVTGHACDANPGVWWVPELGLSMTEGYHLFDSKKDAMDTLISDLRVKKRRIDTALDKALETRREI